MCRDTFKDDSSAFTPTHNTVVQPIGHDINIIIIVVFKTFIIIQPPVQHILGELEVDEFDVTFKVDEYVLRFEVAVHNRVFVQVLEHEQHLAGVQASVHFGELAVDSQMVEKLAARFIIG